MEYYVGGNSLEDFYGCFWAVAFIRSMHNLRKASHFIEVWES